MKNNRKTTEYQSPELERTMGFNAEGIFCASPNGGIDDFSIEEFEWN